MSILSLTDRPVICLATAETDRLSTGDATQHALTLKMLNAVLSTELIGVLRHRRHHEMARDLSARYTGQEFLDCAENDQRHIEILSRRIVELGGVPELTPAGLHGCYHTQLIEDTTLASLLAEDLIAQRNAIDAYRELIKYLGDRDPITRRALALILALEQQHKGEFARKILMQCTAAPNVSP